LVGKEYREAQKAILSLVFSEISADNYSLLEDREEGEPLGNNMSEKPITRDKPTPI
jgi:hypothetical protein